MQFRLMVAIMDVLTLVVGTALVVRGLGWETGLGLAFLAYYMKAVPE